MSFYSGLTKEQAIDLTEKNTIWAVNEGEPKIETWRDLNVYSATKLLELGISMRLKDKDSDDEDDWRYTATNSALFRVLAETQDLETAKTAIREHYDESDGSAIWLVLEFINRMEGIE